MEHAALTHATPHDRSDRDLPGSPIRVSEFGQINIGTEGWRRPHDIAQRVYVQLKERGISWSCYILPHSESPGAAILGKNLSVNQLGSNPFVRYFTTPYCAVLLRPGSRVLVIGGEQPPGVVQELGTREYMVQAERGPRPVRTGIQKSWLVEYRA